MFNGKQLDRIEKKLDNMLAMLGFGDDVTIVVKAKENNKTVSWATELHVNPTVDIEQKKPAPKKRGRPAKHIEAYKKAKKKAYQKEWYKKNKAKKLTK